MMFADYAKQVLKSASAIQKEAKTFSLISLAFTVETQLPGISSPSDPVSLFDTLITESALRETSRQLFSNGHYALAVEEAFKCVNNVVKERSKLPTDGAALMRAAFSLRNPVLRLNSLKTDSQQNQQLGYMDIFAGCMTGIRNPRAHEHRYLDEANVALELLALANHLLRIAHSAKRTRQSRSSS